MINNKNVKNIPIDFESSINKRESDFKKWHDQSMMWIDIIGSISASKGSNLMQLINKYTLTKK